jgi:hypothetical protein
MRVFAQKQNPLQRKATADLARSNVATPAASYRKSNSSHLQRTIENQDAQLCLQANSQCPESSSNTTSTTRFAYDFSRIPVHSRESIKAQTKLVVGAPKDKYEQEADRIGEQVMSANTATSAHLWPQFRGANEIRAKHGGNVPAHGSFEVNEKEENHLSAQEGDAPLPAAVRAYMEPRFGMDFSRVRIHTDAQSEQLNRILHSRAFTVGHEIFLRQGEYNPGSRSGQKLIAHELTHVVQQAGGHNAIAGQPERGATHNHEGQSADLSTKSTRRETAEPKSALAPTLQNNVKISSASPSIQRDIVGTNEFKSGELAIDFKKKEGLDPRDPKGELAGEEGQITFKPVSTAPDMKEIRFVQIARVIETDKGKDGKDTRYRDAEAPRNKMRTAANKDKGVEPGFFVDQLAANLEKRKESTEPQVLPYYDLTIGGSRNKVGWKKDEDSKPAILADWPHTNNFPVKYSFVTSAIESDKKTWLGSVSWGFEVVCEGRKKERKCGVENEHHEFQEEHGATTDAALKKFDKYYRNPGASTAPK